MARPTIPEAIAKLRQGGMTRERAMRMNVWWHEKGAVYGILFALAMGILTWDGEVFLATLLIVQGFAYHLLWSLYRHCVSDLLELGEVARDRIVSLEAQAGITFRLEERDGHVGIRCLKCQRVSYNKNDVLKRYCGACHRFHEEP